jgi:hypothetical protein
VPLSKEAEAEGVDTTDEAKITDSDQQHVDTTSADPAPASIPADVAPTANGNADSSTALDPMPAINRSSPPELAAPEPSAEVEESATKVTEDAGMDVDSPVKDGSAESAIASPSAGLAAFAPPASENADGQMERLRDIVSDDTAALADGSANSEKAPSPAKPEAEADPASESAATAQPVADDAKPESLLAQLANGDAVHAEAQVQVDDAATAKTEVEVKDEVPEELEEEFDENDEVQVAAREDANPPEGLVEWEAVCLRHSTALINRSA